MREKNKEVTKRPIIPDTVSYYDHQEQMAREERHTNRWRIFAIVMFICFVLSNIGWMIYENQFQDVVVSETTQDGNGTNIIGGEYIKYESAHKGN